MAFKIAHFEPAGLPVVTVICSREAVDADETGSNCSFGGRCVLLLFVADTDFATPMSCIEPARRRRESGGREGEVRWPLSDLTIDVARQSRPLRRRGLSRVSN